MRITADLPSEITAYLRGRESLSEVRFTEEFPCAYKESPLKKITVSIGVGDMTINDVSIGNVISVDGNTAEYGRQAEYKILTDIYVPFLMDGKRGFEIFTKLLDELIFNADFDIIKAGCKQVKTSREAGAKILEGWFLTRGLYAAERNEDAEI